MITDNIDSKFNKIAAQIIRKYREQKGLSLEEVTKKMKTPISRQSLYKYENNLARMKNHIFIDICNALGIDPNEIYNEINDEYTISNNKGELFASRLQKAIELCNLKPIEVANKTGLDKSLISCYLSGKYKPNSINRKKLADVLNVDEIWLAGFDVDMHGNKMNLQRFAGNVEQDEIELLYHEHKNILTDSDKAIIKTIIEQRIKEKEN